jgi:Uracil DNA glycosylase superfamily
MLPLADFDRFRHQILNLPLKRGAEKYDKANLICPRFLLFSEANLHVYYAPFHHLNPNARIALVGLTPGWTQMEEAFRAAREGLAFGLDGKRLFEHIDRTGSFSGPMRKNLVAMLDGININVRLGISSCSTLFDSLHHLVHFTSVVSAPIFRSGANYRGSGPRLLQVPKLRAWVVENLAAELASMPQAVIVPLGRVADEAIHFLQGGMRDLEARCLTGFPHPSGANGHRHEDFRRGRDQWSSRVAVWFNRMIDYGVEGRIG